MLTSYLKGKMMLANQEDLLTFKQQMASGAGLPPELASMVSLGGGSELTNQVANSYMSSVSTGYMMGLTAKQGRVPWMKGGQLGTQQDPFNSSYGLAQGQSTAQAGAYSAVPPPPSLRSFSSNGLNSTTNVRGNSVNFVPSSAGTMANESAALITGNPEPAMPNATPLSTTASADVFEKPLSTPTWADQAEAAGLNESAWVSTPGYEAPMVGL